MILFAVVAAGLMLVEIMLIVSVRDLTKSIKKLNLETQEKFTLLVDEINKKFKLIINSAYGLIKQNGGKK